MKLPKLSREIIREEDKPGYSPVIWQPSWNCFCCHDTGTVNPHLARLIVEGYQLEKDKIPRCQNPCCNAGENLDSLDSDMVDYRFTSAICQHLDAIHREDWQQTTQNKADIFQGKVAKLSQQKSLRKNERTSTEEMIAQQKHAAVLNGWGVEESKDSETEVEL